MKQLKKFIYGCLSAMVLLLAGCDNNGVSNSNADEHKHDSSTGEMPMHAQAGSNYADSVNTGLIAEDTLKGSPERTVMANMGKTHIHITYHSPGIRGREIWGKLVPYDKVWVTGAHMATTINFSTDVKVEGKPVKAGQYAFFTIPGKEKWTGILNSRYEQHQADQYNQQEDVARFELTPTVTGNTLQRLTYSIQNTTETTATISMRWDKLQVAFHVYKN